MKREELEQRIARYEPIAEKTERTLQNLENALHEFEVQIPDMIHLFSYYFSPQWMKDHDTDTNGFLPDGLCRSVLGEDTVYDLYSDAARLIDEMKQLCKKFEKEDRKF